jgi:ergothioneine biosynthesis protein EgtB
MLSEAAAVATAARSPRRNDDPLLRERLWREYQEVRCLTARLCAPLTAEDHVVQSMADASPTKWHLAHTSWFFETFLLAAVDEDYHPFHSQYCYLFNSYYNAIGDRIPRACRGLLSRPTVEEVYRYRRHVDERVECLLAEADDGLLSRLAPIVVLGMNHEQQHQELILTDIKHAFGSNPLRPAYRPGAAIPAGLPVPLDWAEYPAGMRWMGHRGDGFAFDNESPRHPVFVESFQLAGRLTTNREYLAFMADGGYERPEFWLSDGWAARCAQDWTAPLYWEKQAGGWWSLTLAGMQPVEAAEPVCHVSYYEADAFARWAGARLPTEAEWETAAAEAAVEGNLLDNDCLHPTPAGSAAPHVPEPRQLFGDVWEWTASPYISYPGYRPTAGALGEYNGKFMCNQLVLRGGSCATPQSHIRASYRNFFPPEARWQFSGIRLAKDS